jgi:hypothetical protein
MSFVGRIEFDVESDEFRAVYLTGAAEWSLDPAAAFRGTRAECEALAGQQPLRCLVIGSPDGPCGKSPSPSDVFAELERRGLA